MLRKLWILLGLLPDTKVAGMKHLLTALLLRNGSELARLIHKLRKAHQAVVQERDFAAWDEAEYELWAVAQAGGLCWPEMAEYADPSRGNWACRRCIKEKQITHPATGQLWTYSVMILCPLCGNKRCPMASDHRNKCTMSNAPGQPGSDYVVGGPGKHELHSIESIQTNEYPATGTEPANNT